MAENKTLAQWESANRFPFGKRGFSKLIGLVVPYAGTVKPLVQELDVGRAVIAMKDRRSVRNHLSSIHALATVNLGEMAANLALMTRQPTDGQWIVLGLEAEYLKKARGSITARCEVEEVDWTQSGDVDGTATLTDEAGDVVTNVNVRWRVGPKKKKSAAS